MLIFRKIENASFLRLRSLMVSYNLPQKTLNFLRLKGARIYAQGQNLFTWTEYRDLDPEFSGRNDTFSYPVPRIYMLGLNVKL